MISLLLVDQKEKESAQIEHAVKETAAKLTDEKWDLNSFRELAGCEEFLKTDPSLQFCCYDTKLDEGLGYATQIRRKYDQMMLMLIADSTTSPYQYLKPGIRPDALLLRPFDSRGLMDIFGEFISSGIEKLKDDGAEKSFLIESKEGNIYLDYNNIFYFEAREKKIYARTSQEEYGFYKSMDDLAGELPEGFVRCHRSYIVNIRKITRIIAAENLAELKQDFVIPISRSYKAALKNRMRNA